MLISRLFSNYPSSSYIIQPNKCIVIYLKYLNLFIHFWTYLPVWRKKNNFPSKIPIEPSSLRIIVFLHTPSNKSLEKQQRDTLLSDRLEIKGLGIYFAKESPPPSSRKFTSVPWGYKFFCGSQPCSPSREQRYYGLIELRPRISVRKLLKILQKS